MPTEAIRAVQELQCCKAFPTLPASNEKDYSRFYLSALQQTDNQSFFIFAIHKGFFMSGRTRNLPSPIVMNMPLSQALGRRRSQRAFKADKLDEPILSAVLWACAGRNDSDGKRTVPSALNLQCVSAYVFDCEGVWLYRAADNCLEELAEGDHRAVTTLAQNFVAQAPVTIMFIADENKAEDMSEASRRRCLALDAGCMMQSAQIACSAMGLASVPRASFDSARVTRAAGLDPHCYTAIGALTIGFGA